MGAITEAEAEELVYSRLVGEWPDLFAVPSLVNTGGEVVMNPKYEVVGLAVDELNAEQAEESAAAGWPNTPMAGNKEPESTA